MKKYRLRYLPLAQQDLSEIIDYIQNNLHTGVIDLPAGVEMVMPGDNVHMTVELITPIAIEAGLRFAIREGGRTVGSGVVAEIIE